VKLLNVLVTGANGFVGSHILEALMQHNGVTPIAACRDRRKLIHAFDGEVREGDLRDRDYLGSLLDGIDVVCHAAAWTSAWNFTNESERLFRNSGRTCATLYVSRITCATAPTGAAP
jgi:uncharacterized protein YbjT (DUF2867 family)